MPKCPNCGSTAQPRTLAHEVVENGDTIEVIDDYNCGCGCCWSVTSFYQALDLAVTEVKPYTIGGNKIE